MSGVTERRWLVVRGQHTAIRVALPEYGILRVGSGEEADVRVAEPGVASLHATIHLDPAIGAEIADEDSGLTRGDPRRRGRGEEGLDQGQKVDLAIGDELRLGPVALSFAGDEPVRRAHRAWSRSYFERRTAELAADSGALVIVLRAAGAGPLEEVLADHLEAGDLVADLGGGEHAVLLAGAGETRARALARGPFAELAARDPELLLGMVALTEARDAAPAELVELARSRLARLTRAEEVSPAIVVEDPAMREVMRMVDQVAASASPVLILGETGAGKDVVAQMIHERSPRALRPLVRASGLDLEDALAEGDGEPDAAPRLASLLARASGGTLLLDEVGGLSARAQIALNNVIESAAVRFLATSNQDLKAEVRRGAFRKDLFFRLNRLSITIPPLRARTAEIVPLAERFARELSESLGRPRAPRLAREAKEKLLAHAWPGNVRELRNTIERALFLAPGDVIGPEHLPLEDLELDGPPGAAAPVPPVASAKPTAASLRDEMAALERARIIEALEQYPTQADAAKALDIPLRTFLNRLDALGIPRPRKTRD